MAMVAQATIMARSEIHPPTPVAIPTPTVGQVSITTLNVTAFAALSTTEQRTLASTWGLSASEYARYLQLMEQSPSGFYYRDQHLDPSWILGLNATDETERRKYVTLAIEHERERLTQLLLFQQLFDKVQKELFPHDKPIVFPAAESLPGVPVTCR